MKLVLGRIESPIGALLAVCHGPTLCALEFADCSDHMMSALEARFGEFVLVERADPGGVCSRMRAYLAGTLVALAELPVDGGGSDFQRNVWRRLRGIPPGEVLSYVALAECLGVPRSVRAVARANALNPINIVVPCHRVIGADGSLRGYSGGLERKRWLLDHEGANLGTRESRKSPDIQRQRHM